MEQFINIIEKEKEPDLIPFLQSLSNDQKKKLSPTIKKYAKEYAQFGQISGNTYGHINGTDKQRDMLQLSSFVCFNRIDYEKSPYAVWMLNNEKIDKIIDWYCPDWFSDFVNKQADADALPYYLHYDWIIELTERGFLIPSKELVAKLMPNMIFETDKKRNSQYKPEYLLKRKITLEEHIWYLFEVATDIHYSGRYLFFNGLASKEDKIGWYVLFKQFSEEKRIDRFRLLKEALQASNRNFNKVLSGWFSELFNSLEPSTEEIIFLQQDLFSVLGAMHSKPVNTALLAIKKIIEEKEFDVIAFLDNVPVLLSSSIKATVISALMILEKLAQSNPVHQKKICLLACQAFIQSDNEVHTRIVKIITKNADKNDTALRQEIAAYYPNMTAAARLALKDLSDAVVTNETAVLPAIDNIEQHAPISAEIQFPKNIEDLVFLASEAFDNNEPWHTDVLPAALLQFYTQIRAEDVYRFEPAFQRALGLAKNGLRSSNGYLDHLLAMFFIDFGHWLIRKFPEAGKSIENIYRKYDSKSSNTSWLLAPSNSSYVEKWTTHKKIPFYDPYHILLIYVSGEIKKGHSLPILSTPTHVNGWIHATVLIDRLYTYQQAGQPVNSMDLQIAISRCSLLNNEIAVAYAAKKLKGEFRELVIFLLSEEAPPQEPFKIKEAWIVASLSKKDKKVWTEFESFAYSQESFKNHTGQLTWETIEEHYTHTEYDYSLKTNITTRKKRTVLNVHKETPTDPKGGGLKKFISGLLSTVQETPVMLYDLLTLKANYLDAEYNDIKRILSLTPGNPAPILAEAINKFLKYSVFWDEGDKKILTQIIQVLHETWKNPGEMEYLLLGSCMLVSDKTIANIAGEIWLKAVVEDSISNQQLGKVIGLHQRVEYAPMKRFTDLVSQQLFKVSALHNLRLQTLFEHILMELPDEPVKNMKKLLEIYIEIIAENGKPILEPAVTDKLKVWANTASLQKLLKPLL